MVRCYRQVQQTLYLRSAAEIGPRFIPPQKHILEHLGRQRWVDTLESEYGFLTPKFQRCLLNQNIDYNRIFKVVEFTASGEDWCLEVTEVYKNIVLDLREVKELQSRSLHCDD